MNSICYEFIMYKILKKSDTVVDKIFCLYVLDTKKV